MVDKLKADYNGSSIRNEISFRLRDDHDGEEGYYEITATVPDYKVDELKHAWTRADEYADVKEVAKHIFAEAVTIDALNLYIKTQGDNEGTYDAIIQSVHRLEEISTYLRKMEVH